MHQVGFNHLPNKEIKSMKTVVQRGSTKYADHELVELAPLFSVCQLLQRKNEFWGAG